MAKRRVGLRTKFSLYLSGIFVFVSGAIIFIFYFFMTNSLKTELIQRGFSIGSTLAKSSADLILDQDIVMLKQRVNDALEFASVNYVIIEDDAHNVLSDTFNNNIPEEIKAVKWELESSLRLDTLLDYKYSAQDLSVYEVLCPVEEGIVGYVRIGMSKKFIDEQIYNAIIIILIVVIVALIFALVILYSVVNSMVRPLVYLTESADRISMGEMETSIKVDIGNEIGDLGDSVERMRESLKAALERLRKR
jgi:methyl-accepting chemotaxis protein